MSKEQKIVNILELLSILEADFTAQSNSLEHNDDVAWDCYSVDAWNELNDVVLKIRSEIVKL